MLGDMQSNVLDFVKLCKYFPSPVLSKGSLTHFILGGLYPLSDTSNSFCILFVTFIRNYTNMPACSLHTSRMITKQKIAALFALPRSYLSQEASHCPQRRYVKLKSNSIILCQCENISSLYFYLSLRNMNQWPVLFTVSSSRRQAATACLAAEAAR